MQWVDETSQASPSNFEVLFLFLQSRCCCYLIDFDVKAFMWFDGGTKGLRSAGGQSSVLQRVIFLPLVKIIHSPLQPVRQWRKISNMRKGWGLCVCVCVSVSLSHRQCLYIDSKAQTSHTPTSREMHSVLSMKHADTFALYFSPIEHTHIETSHMGHTLTQTRSRAIWAEIVIIFRSGVTQGESDTVLQTHTQWLDNRVIMKLASVLTVAESCLIPKLSGVFFPLRCG